MISAKQTCSIFICAFMLFTASICWAADFTQPERDIEFKRSCTRQDVEMHKYFSEQIPLSLEFHHSGSYIVRVHREGLDRSFKLVPLFRLPFEDTEALRKSARRKSQIVGAVIITYTHHTPFITPGTHLIEYDGFRAHIVNVHGYDVASFEATLGPVPDSAPVDEVVGDLDKDSSGLTNITADGKLQLYLQFTDTDGNPVRNGNGTYAKSLLEISIPGIVEDDSSPDYILVEPAEDNGEEA